jgi:PDZ domain
MKTNRRVFIYILSTLIYLLWGGLNTTLAQSKEKKDVYKLGSPPGTYEILSSNQKVIIPFEFYKNKFRFKAQINGNDYYMMLDNGSLWDELLFFGSTKIDSIGFNYTEETTFGMTQADVDTSVSIKIGNLVFNNQKAIVSRYESNRPNLWEGFDGQFSATFFKHFVVKINFDDSNIELIPYETFEYSGDGEEFSMNIGPYNTRTISAKVELFEGTISPIDLLIDLGGLHPLYLPIGKYDDITLPSNAIESGLGSGFFNQKGHKGRVKSFRLGNYILKDVLTAFTSVEKDSDIYGNTMIGLPLLKRFNIVFNYFDNKIILESSKYYNEPFAFNMTGFVFRPDKNGNLKVNRVHPNSPASEANIQVEDIITHVNEISIETFKDGELNSLLEKEGEIVKLDILRKDQLHSIEMKLRDVL